MGAKTTVEISRKSAIERIAAIQRLAASRDFVGIERMTREPDADIKEFVATVVLEDPSRWTNVMLEELMDKPFFRYSIFDNYCIVSGS